MILPARSFAWSAGPTSGRRLVSVLGLVLTLLWFGPHRTDRFRPALKTHPEAPLDCWQLERGTARRNRRKPSLTMENPPGLIGPARAESFPVMGELCLPRPLPFLVFTERASGVRRRKGLIPSPVSCGPAEQRISRSPRPECCPMQAPSRRLVQIPPASDIPRPHAVAADCNKCR